MKLPLELEFRDTESSPAVEAAIREHVSRLDEVFTRITRCRVVIECPHKHHHKGRIWHVHLLLTVPGQELVIGREPENDHAHEDVYVALRDAFESARRALDAHTRKRRGETRAARRASQ